MRKVLYIGWCMPYDSVPHAGGQIFNYYIKQMAKSNDVRVISFTMGNEADKATLQNYGIEAKYIEYEDGLITYIKKFLSINSKLSIKSRYGGIIPMYKAFDLLRYLKKIKCEGYYPDVIVLQWTQIVLLIEDVKRLFPDSRIIAVEEDVTFLRLKREYEACKGITRFYRYLKYTNEKRVELLALNKSDLVYVNNSKDANLLQENKFNQKKLKVLVPYYHKIEGERINKINSKDILFYGNMGRPENYNAAVWFIENVLPYITRLGCRFIVMGGNSEKIKKYESNNVIVTGYVDNPDLFFLNAALFVAPITQGAGIKIKVLEAMSSGIPVVTTSVGIEGIPAIDRESYYYYSTRNELITCIEELLSNPEKAEEVGSKGKKMVNDCFDYEKTVDEYIKILTNC